MTAGKRALLVFLAVAVLLAVLQSNRFVLTNDEGILLEPAQRMAAGARPYVDFFGYMSPGSYWIQASLFRLLGVSLRVARLPVLFDLSLQCALLYWLAARLASYRAATATLLIFLGFQMADPSFLTAQHRWDSATFALAGICVAIGRPSRFGMAASGALIAAAAWCTPSVALVGVAVTLWMVLARERRPQLVPFITGVLALSTVAVGVLFFEGSLRAFGEQMLWLRRNYSAVNFMPYGSVIGGYARLFEKGTRIETVLQVILVACLALPAILPPLAGLAGGVVYWSKQTKEELRPTILLLLLSMAALVASTFPRADVMHLQFVVALPYVLIAVAIARLFSLRAGAIVAFTMIPLAALFWMNDLRAWFSTRPMASPVGDIRVSADAAPEVEKLLSQVRPGQTLFVYPYMPVHYFITQTINPTRFSFLAPGMMTGKEETEVLRQLVSRPPEWLLYMPLTRDEFLRVFPNATGLSERFAILQDWLEKNYRPVEAPSVNIAGYRLRRRASDEKSAITSSR